MRGLFTRRAWRYITAFSAAWLQVLFFRLGVRHPDA